MNSIFLCHYFMLYVYLIIEVKMSFSSDFGCWFSLILLAWETGSSNRFTNVVERPSTVRPCRSKKSQESGTKNWTPTKSESCNGMANLNSIAFLIIYNGFSLVDPRFTSKSSFLQFVNEKVMLIRIFQLEHCFSLYKYADNF